MSLSDINNLAYKILKVLNNEDMLIAQKEEDVKRLAEKIIEKSRKKVK